MKKQTRILIKLGGAALSQSATMDLAAETLQRYRSIGYQVIVVHGGGPAINAQLNRLGITWEFVAGQRVTSSAMMEVIESVLCGGVNKKLVRHFGKCGLPAVGLSGIDGKTLLCRKASPQLGQVGSIQSVNSKWIEEILALPSAPIPLVAPVGVGESGESFNINADWAASHLAVALKVDQLVFITDQKGIVDEEGEVISMVDSSGIENMIQCRIVSGGMLVKSQAILHALAGGVAAVSVMNAFDAMSGLRGTTCTLTRKSVRRNHEEAYAAV